MAVAVMVCAWCSGLGMRIRIRIRVAGGRSDRRGTHGGVRLSLVALASVISTSSLVRAYSVAMPSQRSASLVWLRL